MLNAKPTTPCPIENYRNILITNEPKICKSERAHTQQMKKCKNQLARPSQSQTISWHLVTVFCAVSNESKQHKTQARARERYSRSCVRRHPRNHLFPFAVKTNRNQTEDEHQNRSDKIEYFIQFYFFMNSVPASMVSHFVDAVNSAIVHRRRRTEETREKITLDFVDGEMRSRRENVSTPHRAMRRRCGWNKKWFFLFLFTIRRFIFICLI